VLILGRCNPDLYEVRGGQNLVPLKSISSPVLNDLDKEHRLHSKGTDYADANPGKKKGRKEKKVAPGRK